LISTKAVPAKTVRAGIEKLLIVSHVCHYSHAGRIHAYGPYAREIDIWADLFPRVLIASPLRREEPPADCLAFTRPNIEIVPQLEAGGDSLRAKALQVLALPVLVSGIARAMRRADAIHVRCPGNLGLIGAALAPLFSRYLVAKYAGQWNGYCCEPLSVRMQRFLLKSRIWRKGVVTVYGDWPDQPRQIVPFFTSMMTSGQVRQATATAARKRLSEPVRVLYAGRLASAKCVEVLLRAAAELVRSGVNFELCIVGDGPEKDRLEQLARSLGLHAKFAGAFVFERMMDWYDWAHVLVLPSKHSEGWPKVIAEAMCHGVVCVGTAHGLLPWLLKGRGHLVPAGDPGALARVLCQVATDPEGYLALSHRASEWARGYSLESLRDALQRLLSLRWSVSLTHRAVELRPSAEAESCP
jgi:glycosyltransferase involved in cell wall biosynthesis